MIKTKSIFAALLLIAVLLCVASCSTHKGELFYCHLRYYQKTELNGDYYALYERRVILCNSSDEYEGWDTLARLPFYAYKIYSRDKKLFVADVDLKNYEVNVDNGELTPVTDAKINFEGKKVSDIVISYLNGGCLAEYKDTFRYKLANNCFLQDSRKNNSKLALEDWQKNKRKAMPKEISASVVTQLINIVNQARHKPDEKSFCLSFSRNDLNDYRASLDSLFGAKSADAQYYRYFAESDTNISAESKNKIKRYLSVTDSLGNMTERDYFNALSTMAEQAPYDRADYCIRLNFTDGTYLCVRSIVAPANYYQCPWIGDYNGTPFHCHSLKVGQLIDEMTKGQIIDGFYKQKSYALLRIAHYLIGK